MKLNKKVPCRMHMKLSVLFVLMLLFYTVIPYAGAKAAGQIGVNSVTQVGGSNSIIAEKNIISPTDNVQVILTLNSGLDWAHDFAATGKEQLVINSMKADIDSDAWNTYKASGKISASVSTDYKTLTITLGNDDTFNISNNQTITMALSAALVENWEGTVAPVSFKIYAQPEITMSGSIMNNTTNRDLIKGGKTIDLNLVNATWDKTRITQLGGLNQILDLFKDSTDNTKTWDVAQYLKLVDPNKYVSFINGNKTLRFTLPAIPANQITQTNITFDPKDSDPATTLSSTYIYDSVGGNIGNLEVTSALNFSINTAVDNPTLSVNPTNMTEQTITTNNTASIVLTLAGNLTWSLATNDKKKALIDALVANDQTAQWEKIKNALKNNFSQVSIDSTSSVLTINIPQVAGYSLTKDQTISLNVPYQVLSDNVNLGKQTFTITAQPKVLISGTAVPTVSQSDITKGGKTVVVTLVNGTWANDIATNTTKREALLKGLNWQTSILDAKAQVVRTNAQVVTITLPPIDGYKITSSVNVIFDPSTIQSYITKVSGNPDTFNTTIINDAFTVNPVGNQSATVSGMTNTNEFDIAAGGKTMTITLKNDTWVQDVDPTTNTPIIFSDNQGNQINSIKYDIIRTSDTVVTLTLHAIPGYSIPNDATVTLTIPPGLLTTSSSGIKVNSAFKILAVTASLSGTGLALAPADIQKGGKTIIVKLNNATFNYTDPNFTTNFIGCFTSSGTNWSKVITAIKNDLTKIKATKDTVTITLPAVPDYQSASAETITLNISQSLISNANNNITGDKTITIGQAATALLSTNPGSLAESDIQSGATISITLNGASWDPALATNKSKLSALLNGFTTTDQTKEWALISSAIQSSSVPATISGKTITLTIPAISNYSIIRDQVINVTIPKSILANSNSDISAGQLYITIPNVTADQSLSDLLNGDLGQYIDDNGLNNIRVIVPDKKVQTISVNTIEVPGSGNQKNSVTTIEVTATSDVTKVNVTVKGQNGDITKEQDGTSKFTFVFTNLEENSDFTVSVYGDSSSDPLQADIYEKITSGSKTFSEEPNTSLAGSYSLYSLLTDQTLLSNIFKYYSANDLKVGTY